MGRALARLLAARGDAVVLLGRDAGELAASARDLTARGAKGPVATGHLDLGDTAGFASALAAADEAVGGVDTLVVTAGDFAAQEELERDPARLRHLFDVNFTATAVLCQQMAERLAARGGGTICAFSSVAGDRPRRRNFLYGASKAGLSAFLDGLGLAYGDRGVRVVCVRPGFVKTGMTAVVRHIASRWGHDGIRANAVAPGSVPGADVWEAMPQDRRDRLIRMARSNRIGRADDIASMVTFLLSDDGSWVTGQVIAVDGGVTMRP